MTLEDVERRPQDLGHLASRPGGEALGDAGGGRAFLTQVEPVGVATADSIADTVACTRLELCYCSSVGDSAPGQSMEGLGAPFWYGLDGRAMSREQIAVACHAGGPR